MSRTPRVLALALDAADPGLAGRFAAEGDMPALASLLRDAAVVDTLAPPGVFVSANWPTLFTATQPDRHHYLCWEEIRGASYERRLTDPTMIRAAPIWRRLSDAGRRVTVIDVPHSVAEPVNGTMLVEWGCHDRHLGTTSWPDDLAQDISARHGAHLGTIPHPGFPQFAPCDYAHRAGAHRTADETAALFADVLVGLERKRAVSLELLERDDWDFFFTVMGESHCVGHQLWHLHDTTHPGHDPVLISRLGGDPLRQVYRRLDALVAEHLARLGPDDTAYVLLAHGMVGHHDGTHLLDQVLHRLDHALDEPDALGTRTRVAAELAQIVPAPLRRPALRRAAPLLRSRVGHPAPAQLPPLAGRRWYQTPNNTVVGAVRLNLAGREPDGRLQPGDRRAVLEWLSDRLTELVNLDTGGRVVRRCWFTDDVYRRSKDDAFGDLHVEWERSAPIERVWSPAVGTVAVPYEHWRQGDHEPEGILLATGPGIAPGRRPGVHDIVHVGATLAAAAGVTLPDADGRPIGSVLPTGATAWGEATPRPAAHPLRARAGRALRRRARRRVPGWARGGDAGVAGRSTAVSALGSLAQQALGHAQEAVQRARAASDGAAAADARAREARAEAVDSGRAGARALEEQAGLARRLDTAERQLSVATMRAWLHDATVPEDVLVSVVLPTRDRAHLLGSAIDSVVAQSYGRWELLVVDDGSTDDTAERLATLHDERIRIVRTDGAGVCAARNAALDEASGDVIAYLDDDNRFDPEWLKAVALTYATLPGTAVAYGARVVDDGGRLLDAEATARPWMHFVGWDGEAVKLGNLVDMNVLTHRAGDVRFDEELSFLGDWDLLLALTEDAVPAEIPTIAAYYRTDEPTRMSAALSREQIELEFSHVLDKLGREREDAAR